eukprot:3078021-Amphidinium_carterae.2
MPRLSTGSLDGLPSPPCKVQSHLRLGSKSSLWGCSLRIILECRYVCIDSPCSPVTGQQMAGSQSNP